MTLQVFLSLLHALTEGPSVQGNPSKACYWRLHELCMPRPMGARTAAQTSCGPH